MADLLEGLKNIGHSISEAFQDAVDATKTNLRHLDDDIRGVVSDAVSATKTNLRHLNDDLGDVLPIVQRALDAYVGYSTGDWVKVVGAVVGGETASNLAQIEKIKKTYDDIINKGKDIPPPRGTTYTTREGKTWVEPTVYDEYGNVVDVPAYGELISDTYTNLQQYNDSLANQAINIATGVMVDTEAIAEVMDREVYAIQDLTDAVLTLDNDDLTAATRENGTLLWTGLNYLSNDLAAATLKSGSMISESLDREVQDISNTITDTNYTLFDGLHNLNDTISSTVNELIGKALKPIGLMLENIGENIWEAFLSVFFEDKVV